MALSQYKVLTFDVVGTLIDFERGMLDYLRSVAPAATVTDDDFLAAYRASRGSQQVTAYPDDLVRVWHEIAPQLGLPNTPGIAEGLRDSVPKWPAFPDAPEALQRLRKRFKLVTMTNAQRWALKHFEHTLGEPFDMALSCDDALCEKPDPRYFAYARGRYEGAWGFTQAQNLHVAQSQYHDIGIAHKLGIDCCWIERRAGQKGFGGTLAVDAITRPDYHFRTLAELADAVEAEG
ncbi:HAD-IA family hydrolase [Aquincola tertiaricarbonis]|uniref:HAD-IA family hydrolase n=1 Tax=Aquincola tertiaricarbonis TaxID=391953 RepID=UPI0006153735|nr:HAD-IA family hydrolase [Aquincola tertiaricarbonis]